MAPKPFILSSHEPLVDQTGRIRPAWFPQLSALFGNSGTVSAPLVVQSSLFLNEATVSSGGTISSPDLPAGTLIGNGGKAAGPPETLDVGPSLSLSAGTLGIAPLAGGTLLGNSGPAAATPGPIVPGANLTLSNGTLAATGDVDDQALLYSIRDTRGQIARTDHRVAALETMLHSIRDSRGQIAALERRVNDALTLALSPPKSVASASVTVAAHSLFGNAGTVVSTGTSVAIGAGLSLSVSGTLTATGTAIYAPMVNGDLPGPSLMVDPHGQVIMAQIR